MKRLFRGLRDHAPRASYDAVVVGSGVGGLVAANLLTREGLSVLLVEQHYMTGGYCSTFRRGGITFDASTHFYPLLGNPQTLPGRLLGELGVETEWVRMDPVDTFHLPDGSRFHVPADLESYRARLDAAFPEERAAIERFFGEVREAYLLGLLAYFRGRETRRFRELEPLTLKEVLDRSFASERLKLVLTADCPHWGSPPSRTLRPSHPCSSPTSGSKACRSSGWIRCRATTGRTGTRSGWGATDWSVRSSRRRSTTRRSRPKGGRR